MPNGRNAEFIFGRNADGRMPTATARFQAECRKQERPEMKACLWQKSSASERLLLENFWDIIFRVHKQNLERKSSAS